MEADLDLLTKAVLAAMTVLIGGGWAVDRRRMAKRSTTAPDEPGESVVTKAEARALADAAAASAAKDAQVVATLQSLRSSIDAHEHRDAERFTESERRAAEQHGALMGEIARMAAEHERVRTRVHSLADTVAAHAIKIPYLQERIDDTRRQANIDSGVHDTRKRPR